MKRFVNPVPQFLLNNGDIASSGKLYFFENGSTTNLKDTFADEKGAIKNQNPVILSGEGRVPTIWGEGLYTIVFKSADDVQQWVRHGVELDGSDGQFSDYSPNINYRKNEIARYDGSYWISDVSGNLGNTPASGSSKWTRITFIFSFNPAKAGGYATNDIVNSLGLLYRSTTDNNTSEPPGGTWQNLTFNDSIAGNFSVGGILDAGSARINSNLQVGPTAGTRVNYNDLGQISKNGAAYLDIAERRSVRVSLGGGFGGSNFIVLEKIGRTVIVTSAGILSHASSTSVTSDIIIPTEYRIGSSYSAGLKLMLQTLFSATARVEIYITFEGRLVISYYDISGSPVSALSPGVGICGSYTITSETP